MKNIELYQILSSSELIKFINGKYNKIVTDPINKPNVYGIDSLTLYYYCGTQTYRRLCCYNIPIDEIEIPYIIDIKKGLPKDINNKIKWEFGITIFNGSVFSDNP